MGARDAGYRPPAGGRDGVRRPRPDWRGVWRGPPEAVPTRPARLGGSGPPRHPVWLRDTTATPRRPSGGGSGCPGLLSDRSSNVPRTAYTLAGREKFHDG